MKCNNITVPQFNEKENRGTSVNAKRSINWPLGKYGFLSNIIYIKSLLILQ